MKTVQARDPAAWEEIPVTNLCLRIQRCVVQDTGSRTHGSAVTSKVAKPCQPVTQRKGWHPWHAYCLRGDLWLWAHFHELMLIMLAAARVLHFKVPKRITPLRPWITLSGQACWSKFLDSSCSPTGAACASCNFPIKKKEDTPLTNLLSGDATRSFLFSSSTSLAFQRASRRSPHPQPLIANPHTHISRLPPCQSKMNWGASDGRGHDCGLPFV